MSTATSVPPEDRKKIMFVLVRLGTGGSERQALALAREMSRRGHKVIVALREVGELDVAEGLYDGPIRTYGWSQKRAVKKISRFIGLRMLIVRERPCLLIAYGTPANFDTLLASYGYSGVTRIISERNNPYRRDVALLKRLGRWMLYRRAHIIVVQTTALVEWASRLAPGRRVVTIPNMLVEEKKSREKEIARDGCTLMAVGRFDFQKGFDVLLEAFSLLAARFPHWELVIYGDGQQRGELVKIRKRLGLEERVHFPGVARKIGSHLMGADVFVLSSRFEGFPNVLLEAMSRGVPCVSFDCDFGPRDLIEDGVSGLLVKRVPDASALAGVLARVMEDYPLRQKLGRAAAIRAGNFEATHIVNKWFEEVVDKAGPTE